MGLRMPTYVKASTYQCLVAHGEGHNVEERGSSDPHSTVVNKKYIHSEHAFSNLLTTALELFMLNDCSKNFRLDHYRS